MRFIQAMLRHGLLGVAAVLWGGPAQAEAGKAAPYLFVWSGDADEEDSDFLAVIDVRRTAPSYGQVVATFPVGARATMPHHSQYEYPPDHHLFLNGWKAGRTFVVDVSDPLAPKPVADFTQRAGYSYPHSYARLPGGHILATFQAAGTAYAPPGGLVEMDARGQALRSAPSATAQIPDSLNWPYSLIVLPDLDRAISTSADMGLPPWEAWEFHDTHHVQIWSLHDLKLVANADLPKSPEGSHHIAPAEPRRLANGAVFVNTFTCGLYRIDNPAGAAPTAAFVHAFPGGDFGSECAVPVVFGNYWVQTVPALPGLIVMDLSDPQRPVESARLVLSEAYKDPHWLAADRAGGRIVLTGNNRDWVLLLNVDAATGEVHIDESFRAAGAARPGVFFNRQNWPHGDSGPAWVHGALFRTAQ